MCPHALFLQARSHISTTLYPTHHQHLIHSFIVRANSYKIQLFPRTMNYWNNLHVETIKSPSVEQFLVKLHD